MAGLGKMYRIGHDRARPTTVREALTDALTAPWRRLSDLAGAGARRSEEFWALRAIDLSIREGDVLGVIGRNGAGKSTLLKILSRIVEPTEGRAVLRGRVSSLLEVGTGFHPDLTGRENIYLNGSILGMRKREIAARFDEIVDFAEVERFLDTPVKRYSSGMHVRLAFAVAAHLDPEVLIVDEVLAVGDAAFRSKCLERMRVVASAEGRVVIIVSHDLSVVTSLCNRGVVLDAGRLTFEGTAADAVAHYQRGSTGAPALVRVRTNALRWIGLRNHAALQALSVSDDVELELVFGCGPDDVDNVYVDIALHNERDQNVVHCRSKFVTGPISIRGGSQVVVHYRLRSPGLAPGKYYITVYAQAGASELCWVERIDACNVLARSALTIDGVVDGIRSTTLPAFSVTCHEVETDATTTST